MTIRQAHAMNLLRQARKERPSTDDGVVSDWTYYDPEVGVAFIHWNTARSLERLGLVTLDFLDPDNGTTITLTQAAVA